MDVLVKERKKAEKEHSRAGLLTAARATEVARKQWVKDELVRIGTERARSLGWTDCYTFTKAMGERVVEQWRPRPGNRRASIVRPSIIESALERPHVGWIEGFKMAEPLILAYGRGELPEFPASADTIVDIVPVDHVVSAIVAVLAHPPEPAEVGYFHVSSGDRNPLTFSVLYSSVRTYFDHHPFTAGDRGAARLPEWRFPGARSVERLLTPARRRGRSPTTWSATPPAATGLATWPASCTSRVDGWSSSGATSTSTWSTPPRSCASPTSRRWRSTPRSPPRTARTFAFDTAVVDWPHYFIDVHCPAVTAPVRRLDELRALRKKPAPVGLRQVSSGGTGIAAFFDMDGTLLSSNVIETYLWVRLRELDGGERFAELGRIASKVPSLVQAERRSRSDFLRGIYREYAGAREADLDAVVDEHLTDHILSRLSPDGVRRIREHRAAGHQTVLITGAIRPLTRPLLPLFDHIEAADLAVDARGVCTGHLASSPLVGESGPPGCSPSPPSTAST